MGEIGGNVEQPTAEISSNNREVVDYHQTSMEKKLLFADMKKKSLLARYAYGVIFLLTNVIAWLFRDYGERILPMLPYSRACGAEEKDCFHTMGVLRVSLGCFIFFFVMFVTTCHTKKLNQVRNSWHSGWWALKSVLLIIAFVIPFFIPADYVQIYGEISRVGAGIFLILQLISVIEFITWWNNYWMSDDTKKSSCSIGLFMSTIFYVASVGGIVVMYVFYASKTSCSLNIFFISWTAILLFVMMVISLHSKVNRGLLSSGIMASYIVFLCWTAIRSEPTSEKCSHEKQESGHGGWSTIVGFVIAICAIVIATFSTGIDSKTFQLDHYFPSRATDLLPEAEGKKEKIEKEIEDEVQLQEDDIRYHYGFFHIVFSLGAMYFAMLFISWNLSSLSRKWSIDVGWASTWVKIVNEWFAATIYMWKLIFPVLRQPKVMSREDAVEEADKSTTA